MQNLDRLNPVGRPSDKGGGDIKYTGCYSGQENGEQRTDLLAWYCGGGCCSQNVQVIVQ